MGADVKDPEFILRAYVDPSIRGDGKGGHIGALPDRDKPPFRSIIFQDPVCIAGIDKVPVVGQNAWIRCIVDTTVYLVGVIGGKSRVSEILNKKKRLTVDMIRELERILHISASVLVNNYNITK